jgi:hypothetical protein
MPELDQALAGWQESPITALNPWYPLCADAGGWRACVPSAIAFLCGSFPDQVREFARIFFLVLGLKKITKMKFY